MRYNPIGKLQDAEARRELQRVAVAFERAQTLDVLGAPPEKAEDGKLVVCNGTTWNPLGDGVKRPIWYDADADLWKQL